MMQAFEDIILKLLLEALLVIKLLSQVSHFVGETFLSHAKIVHDQSQVIVHTIKVLELLSHLVGLLIEALNLNFTGSDISLEFLNFVIKDELELLQLLGLLLQVVDALVLVTDGRLTFLDFTLL